MDVVVIGAGAIGGTLGAHMARAGHRVLLCDQDAEHVAAIRADGLRIEGPVEEFTVRVDAVTPDELPDRIDHAIVAVKSLHTASAAELLRDRLAPDGWVLTVQNGLTADTLVDVLGADRVVSSFVNVGADLMGPGRILQGNVAAFHVGELAGGEITPRVREMVEALPYARATDNVLGYLWGKEVYGAMLWAGAVSDLPIADTLDRDAYEPLMLALAREVMAQAPVRVEGFDGFEPDDLEVQVVRLARPAGGVQPAERQDPQRHLPRPHGAPAQDRGRPGAPRHPGAGLRHDRRDDPRHRGGPPHVRGRQPRRAGAAGRGAARRRRSRAGLSTRRRPPRGCATAVGSCGGGYSRSVVMCSRYHSTVERSPSSSPMEEVHPASASLDTSSSFCGVPSGFDVSHSVRPS
jgi:2-dehydropantoate 2-reductase